MIQACKLTFSSDSLPKLICVLCLVLVGLEVVDVDITSTQLDNLELLNIVIANAVRATYKPPRMPVSSGGSNRP